MNHPRILVNVFHPDLENSRGSIRLLQALEGSENVTVRQLYDIYPDFAVDVKTEQQLLRDHDVIVFQHPFYWYSSPSLMKEWIDRVLEQGFAFPPGVGDEMNGKTWLSVLTTGGAQDAYRSGGFNAYTMSELLRPFQRTAELAGMAWLPPIVVHGVLPEGIAGHKNITDEELAARAVEYRELLDGLQA
ncbi:MAG: hypothetical protein GY838_13955 [bacterium]|nr:hypothetical protein [bacterium]